MGGIVGQHCAMKIKLLLRSDEEQRTLRETGIFHPHPRARMCVEGILHFREGLTLQTAMETRELGPSVRIRSRSVGEGSR